VGPFQNCILKLRPPFKMADVTNNINFLNCPLLLYYKSKWPQILTEATRQWLVCHIFPVFLLNIVVSRFIPKHNFIKDNFEMDPQKGNHCQVCFNFVQWFQRRRFRCKSLRWRRTPSDGKSSHDLLPGWQTNTHSIILV
jgi:hypothetical protein